MNAIDTNVLVYRLDRNELGKQAKARDLLRQLRVDPTPTILPWQVAGEFVRQLRAWKDQKKITSQTLHRYAAGFRRLFPLVMPTPAVLDRAIDLANRWSLSHWDSMILGACLEAGVDTLYTEDMGAPTTIEGVRLINPFV